MSALPYAEEPVRSLLVAMGEAFPDEHLDLELPFGLRNDILADFVHFETISVAGHFKASQAQSAIAEVSRALGAAQAQIQSVLEALPQSHEASAAELLSAADAAYCGGEAYLTAHMSPGQRGDTLADYIYFAIVEEPLTRIPAQTEFLSAIEKLQTCRQAVDAMQPAVHAPRLASRG